MDISDVRMAGHILLNEKGKRLNHNRFWSDQSEGWIWNDTDLQEILRECGNWEFKPTHKQQAYLSRKTGKAVTYGKLERVTV